MPLKTTGQIAESLNIPIHRVKYVVQRFKIRETQRIGTIRAFDEKGVNTIEKALKQNARKVFDRV